MNMPTWMKPGIWGGVIGAVGVVIVGFGAGWVTSSGNAKEMANSRAEKAVVAALTPICVAQFKVASALKTTTATGDTAGPDGGEVLLAALKKEKSWERSEFVVKQGWATMPGSAKANGDVASTCATELMKMADKAAAK